MGTGKKKIEIEKITKQTARMVAFSKRRKGLFRKAEELESMSSSRVTSVVISPFGKPYTYGNVNSVIKKYFSICIRPEISTPVMNSHPSSSNVSGESLGSKSSSTPNGNALCNWVEGIDVEECQNLNQLLMLKKQLEGTREKIVSKESESFQALFI
ncbi:agamous-like MADS-box protein AGL61 [Solanum lycopersicum]|uniref:MADS-box domain-containing protein n=1 Tax=Solanum lycopersicum TaxID=4081 RepID=A0A3Q7EMH5_SOLLC|nr:agamous-like MADS-box protein AGL61 [Solanum lycopersicum]